MNVKLHINGNVNAQLAWPWLLIPISPNETWSYLVGLKVEGQGCGHSWYKAIVNLVLQWEGSA
jgi:hypothetical protein